MKFTAVQEKIVSQPVCDFRFRIKSVTDAEINYNQQLAANIRLPRT